MGDATGGPDTGCSSSCRIEDGWDCSRTSPSRCWRSGSRGGGGGGSEEGGGSGGEGGPGDNPHGPDDPHFHPDSGGGGGDVPPPGGQAKSGGHAGLIVGIVLGTLALVAAGEPQYTLRGKVCA